ncbi:MAG: hypothetical protein ACI8W3_001927 [Myxococcota bacterium]|jgi:hypothetical protein
MNWIGRHVAHSLVPSLFALLLLAGGAQGKNPSAARSGEVQAETQAVEAGVEESEDTATSLSDEVLDGREIYRRMLANKYRRGVQKVEIVSSDPGGSEQATAFTASLEDNRDENEEPVDGKNASLLIEVTSPFDMRHTRYLMIAREPGPDDEFIYKPSDRLVRRVDLKSTPLLGTDYTFDDLAYHDIDGAEYKRLPDEVVAGLTVFVVDALVTDLRTSQVHRSLSYIEQEHYIPIKVRYWDEYDVEIKEMNVDVESIRSYGETWIAARSTMRDLLLGTSSRSNLLSLDTTPKFNRQHFSQRRLSQGN